MSEGLPIYKVRATGTPRKAHRWPHRGFKSPFFFEFFHRHKTQGLDTARCRFPGRPVVQDLILPSPSRLEHSPHVDVVNVTETAWIE